MPRLLRARHGAPSTRQVDDTSLTTGSSPSTPSRSARTALPASTPSCAAGGPTAAVAGSGASCGGRVWRAAARSAGARRPCPTRPPNGPKEPDPASLRPVERTRGRPGAHVAASVIVAGKYSKSRLRSWTTRRVRDQMIFSSSPRRYRRRLAGRWVNGGHLVANRRQRLDDQARSVRSPRPALRPRCDVTPPTRLVVQDYGQRRSGRSPGTLGALYSLSAQSDMATMVAVWVRAVPALVASPNWNTWPLAAVSQ